MLNTFSFSALKKITVSSMYVMSTRAGEHFTLLTFLALRVRTYLVLCAMVSDCDGHSKTQIFWLMNPFCVDFVIYLSARPVKSSIYGHVLTSRQRQPGPGHEPSRCSRIYDNKPNVLIECMSIKVWFRSHLATTHIASWSYNAAGWCPGHAFWKMLSGKASLLQCLGTSFWYKTVKLVFVIFFYNW